MIRLNDQKEIVIDLDGPQGNLFALLGFYKNVKDRLEPVASLEDIDYKKMSYPQIVALIDQRLSNTVTFVTASDNLFDRILFEKVKLLNEDTQEVVE